MSEGKPSGSGHLPPAPVQRQRQDWLPANRVLALRLGTEGEPLELDVPGRPAGAGIGLRGVRPRDCRATGHGHAGRQHRLSFRPRRHPPLARHLPPLDDPDALADRIRVAVTESPVIDDSVVAAFAIRTVTDRYPALPALPGWHIGNGPAGGMSVTCMQADWEGRVYNGDLNRGGGSKRTRPPAATGWPFRLSRIRE